MHQDGKGGTSKSTSVVHRGEDDISTGSQALTMS